MNNNIKNNDTIIRNTTNKNNKNNKNNNSISKMFIMFFIIIIVIMIVLMFFYYILPNNYITEQYVEDDFNLMNIEKIKMEPKSEILLDYYTNKNYYIKIKSKKLDKLRIKFCNSFKSQNVKLKSGYLVKSNFYSDLKIVNNSNHTTIVNIKYFTKKNKRN